MSQYFIHDGKQKLGPFTPDQLKEKQISGSVLVWKEGLKDWVPAGKVDELKDILVPTPPPIRVRSGRSNNVAGWIFGIAVLLIGGFLMYNYVIKPQMSGSSDYVAGESSEQKEREVKEDLRSIENRNPTRYLSIEAEAWQNFIDQNVFRGTITNYAKLSTYKDIEVEATYLSQTGTELGSDRFTIYEFVGPGKTIAFKEKLPETTKNYKRFSIKVIGATPTNR